MFHLQLVSLKGTLLDAAVAEVILPTLEGRIGIGERHMPLASILSRGVITVRHEKKDSDNKIECFVITGGVIEFSDNHLRVLITEASHQQPSSELNK